MPLVLRQAITSEIVLGIWQIDERPEELLALCPEDDRRESEQFTNPYRQREWLAWHALLQQLHPGAKAEYDAQGGPTLDINRHIGVSHTRGYAAVILAPTPCAIDIENVDRDFSRALPRYTTPQEQLIGATLPDPQLYPALFWCAKETLYKLKRQSEIDFLQDMQIVAIDPVRQTLQTRMQETTCRLHYLQHDTLCCVYAWE